MSRVAKKPVAIAKGVEINVQGGSINVKGPKGTLSIAKPEGVDVVVENGHAQMSASDASLVPMAGTLRAILANMVQGVSEGFVRKLELVGVGYRASMAGQDLNLALGFSVAASPTNLLFCLIGVTLGTLIGVLPGIGATRRHSKQPWRSRESLRQGLTAGRRPRTSGTPDTLRRA